MSCSGKKGCALRSALFFFCIGQLNISQLGGINMDKPIKDVINNSYKKEVDYYIPKDLGYTLGTVYKNLQTWVEKELKV